MTKHRPDNRGYILKTALLLFLENGYKNVSYQDLVNKTNLSKGAIYHYFTSKETLLTAVFSLFSNESKELANAELIDEVRDLQSFKQIYIGIRKAQLLAFRDFIGSEIANFNWVRFCLEAVEVNEDLRNIIRRLYTQEVKFFEACFIRLKKYGAIKGNKDALLLAENLYHLIEGAGLVMFLLGNKVDDDYIARFEQLFDGFFLIIN